MGIKLVYYRVGRGRLFFGSEIRAIQSGCAEGAEVDPVALNLFLNYRFTPSPHTIFPRPLDALSLALGYLQAIAQAEPKLVSESEARVYRALMRQRLLNWGKE